MQVTAGSIDCMDRHLGNQSNRFCSTPIGRSRYRRERPAVSAFRTDTTQNKLANPSESLRVLFQQGAAQTASLAWSDCCNFSELGCDTQPLPAYTRTIAHRVYKAILDMCHSYLRQTAQGLAEQLDEQARIKVTCPETNPCTSEPLVVQNHTPVEMRA